MAVCADTAGGEDVLTLTREHHPDVVLMDLSLGSAHGLNLTRALLEHDSSVRVLVLSMHDEVLFAERALRAGARGYLMKQEAAGELLDGIRRVAAGEICISPRMAERVVAATAGRPAAAQTSPMERLTDREREVYELIGRGLGTSAIAARLFVSVKTIETHRAHIKEKLGLQTGPELIRSAVSWIESV
jgi:DNA-binding NarL/FixJ family response regulator